MGSLAASLLINADAVKDRILIAGGVERLNNEEVASKISAVVGKPIRYKELIPDGWRAALSHRVIVPTVTMIDTGNRKIAYLRVGNASEPFSEADPISDDWNH